MHGRHATTSLFASVVGWLLQGLVNQLCRLSSLALRNHDTPMTKLQQQREAGQPTPNPLQLPFMLIQVWGYSLLIFVIICNLTCVSSHYKYCFAPSFTDAS